MMDLNKLMALNPTKLTKVATACVLLTINDFGGNTPFLANAVKVKSKAKSEGSVRMPIKRVAHEFTQV